MMAYGGTTHQQWIGYKLVNVLPFIYFAFLLFNLIRKYFTNAYVVECVCVYKIGYKIVNCQANFWILNLNLYQLVRFNDNEKLLQIYHIDNI